jgi:alpha-beta hydrolase superfamily lysophospholipase
VIASNNEVLNNIKLKTKNSKFVLIGFSGGASVATLLASQRDDIAGLITVAGDLNHEALNQYHHTTLMPESLNPTHVTHLLHQIPQQHWSGEKDNVVPSWVAEAFTQKVNAPHCKSYILKGASHHKGWEEKWIEIIRQFPA